MNKCNDCNSCNPCKNACSGPAQYLADFSIMVDPFNEDIWNITFGGKLFHVHAPHHTETDTSIALDYTAASFVYNGEKHTDTITGDQLGSLINLGSLRDVDTDYDTPSMCYELIYSKYGDCGKGCFSVESGWHTFSPDNDNALVNQLHYIRGTNQYGCPKFLDLPDDPTKWWWVGWRQEGDGKEFGYFQPRVLPKTEFPKNDKGEHVFLTQDPETGEPMVSSIPLDCIWNNILGNFGMSPTSAWSVIEETPQFGADFNNMTGDFVIKWSDWNSIPLRHRAGYGRLYGRVAWDVKADILKGEIVIHITGIEFHKAEWIMDEGVTISGNPSLHVYKVLVPGTEKEEIYQKLNYGGSSWEGTINKEVPCDITITLRPGEQPQEPLNFVYIWVDWHVDDKGYLGVQFKNNISGWIECMQD